jgi:tRNA modification GTPase
LVAGLIGFAEDYFGSGEEGLIGRERQRQLLQQTAASLRRSMTAIGQGEELAAEELRTAVHSLGRLLGRVDVEDILDAIFRDFCIGK